MEPATTTPCAPTLQTARQQFLLADPHAQARRVLQELPQRTHAARTVLDAVQVRVFQQRVYKRGGEFDARALRDVVEDDGQPAGVQHSAVEGNQSLQPRGVIKRRGDHQRVAARLRCLPRQVERLVQTARQHACDNLQPPLRLHSELVELHLFGRAQRRSLACRASDHHTLCAVRLEVRQQSREVGRINRPLLRERRNRRHMHPRADRFHAHSGNRGRARKKSNKPRQNSARARTSDASASI